MPSPAAIKYFDEIHRTQILRKVANDPRLKPISHTEKQIYYHAALTASVATREAYINNLVREFFNVTSDPLTLTDFDKNHVPIFNLNLPL